MNTTTLTQNAGNGALRDASDATPTLTVVDEADDYGSALAGVAAGAVRIGKGTGPIVVLGMLEESLKASKCHFGFPVTAGAEVPPGRLVAAYFHDTPDESRWRGLPLHTGDVIVYPPGAEHVALNHAGTTFTYVMPRAELLMGLAGRLGLPAELPRDGAILTASASQTTMELGSTMDQLARAALAGDPLGAHSDLVLIALARVLAGDPQPERHVPGRGLDDWQIVARCIEYASSIERIPSLSELCLVTHVSDRRVRSAFSAEFDRPPTAFFRTWALDRAHRRLRDSSADECSVTEIACDLGFGHLGRFAAYYGEVYGETPSRTLHAA